MLPIISSILNRLVVTEHLKLTPPIFSEAKDKWVQVTETGRVLGFLGFDIDLPDNEETVSSFLEELASSPACGFQVGVRTWREEAEAATWKQGVEGSALQDALISRRRAFLQEQASISQQNFLIVQVELGQTNEANREEMLQQELVLASMFVMSLAAVYHIPIRPQVYDMLVSKNEGQDVAVQLDPQKEILVPARLTAALQEFSAATKAPYQVALTGVKSQDQLYARCVIRVFYGESCDGTIARNLPILRSCLRRHGLAVQGGSSQDPMTWPRLSRSLSCLPVEALSSYVPAVRLMGQPPSKGGVPLISRSGQLRTFDPFAGNQNANVFLGGQAGAGTTFLAKDILVQHLSSSEDTAAWVIDEYHQYSQLADALEGTVVKIDGETAGVDVLGALSSKEALEDNQVLVIRWLEMLAKPSFSVSEDHKVLWGLVLAKALSSTTALSLSTFVDHLKQEQHPLAQESSLAFEGYLKGELAGYFLHSVVLPDASFTVLDLSSVESLPYSVRPALAQSAAALVHLKWYSQRNTPQKKLLFVDDEGVGDVNLLQCTLRQARKYNGGVVIVGRLYAICNKGHLQEASSLFQYILAMRGNAYSLEGLPFVPASVLKAIEALRVVVNEYAEVMLIEPEGHTAFKFCVDALTAALYDSRPALVGQYRELRQQGMAPLEALTVMAKAKS